MTLINSRKHIKTNAKRQTEPGLVAFLRHPTTKRSGSILTTPEPARGWQPCKDMTYKFPYGETLLCYRSASGSIEPVSTFNVTWTESNDRVCTASRLTLLSVDVLRSARHRLVTHQRQHLLFADYENRLATIWYGIVEFNIPLDTV